jgi:hypothetical protein
LIFAAGRGEADAEADERQAASTADQRQPAR